MSQNLLMAQQQLEMFSKYLNSMMEICQSKCVVSKYADDQIAKGESVCLDRCSAKYFETQEKVGQLYADEMQKLQATPPLQ